MDECVPVLAGHVDLSAWLQNTMYVTQQGELPFLRGTIEALSATDPFQNTIHDD